MTSLPSAPTQADLWSCDDGQIRVTPYGQPSIFDMIRVLGGQKHPYQVWERAKKALPEAASWVEYHHFPGRGQRPTPVLLDLTKADEVLELTRIWAKSSPKRIGNLIAPVSITERNIHRAVFQYLEECGDNPREYVACRSGIADIVTDHTVIEVKDASLWKAAIGQAIVYGHELEKYPEVALFGKADFARILEVATELSIACSCYPSDSSLTQAMLQNTGAATFDNIAAVTRHISARTIARRN